jgi:hypothetical protein
MSNRLKQCAKVLVNRKSCAAAVAIVPMAAPLIITNRTRASVLYSFDNGSVERRTTFGAYTATMAVAPGLFAFAGVGRDDGGTKITGSIGPIDGQGAADYGVIFIHLAGSMTGTLAAADRMNANADFTITASAGTVEYAGMLFSTSIGMSASDLSSSLITGGHFTKALTTDPYGGEALDISYGNWTLDIGVRWSPPSVSDTLTITIPANSIDVYLPEPFLSGAIVLPAILLLRRNRRPTYADYFG